MLASCLLGGVCLDREYFRPITKGDGLRYPIALSPAVWQVLGPIVPVEGTDGRIHLSFVIHLTNHASIPMTIQSWQVIDPDRDNQPTGDNQVVSIENGTITQKVQPFHLPLSLGNANYTDKLEGGQGGTVFFDVTYKDRGSLPAHISNRVVVTAPEGKAQKTYTAIDEPVTVDPQEPVVLKPPLKGPRWLDGNGCCKQVGPHRGVINPINGALEPAEDFAIDFMQLDAKGRAYSGNIRDVKSFAYYDVPVYAAAPGTVVEVVRDLPNQIPGANPEGLSAWQAAGNRIIVDIGRGRYVLYAHLVPGSPTVQVGDLVKVGSVIGRLGNSGLTDSPHLHFQVMDRPSSLGAHGLPFRFDSMKREATYKGSLAKEESQFLAGESLDLDIAGAGSFRNKMPLTLDLLDF